MSADLRVIASLFLDQARALWPFYLGGVLFAAFIKTEMDKYSKLIKEANIKVNP